MNTIRTRHGAIGIALLTVGIIGGWAAARADVRVSIDQVPEAVRTALQQAAGDAPLLKIQREQHHGITTYEGKWSRDGVMHEAEVTAEGALIEMEESTTLDRVPPAVRAAIIKHFGASAIVSIEKKTLVIYEAETMIGGKEHEVLIFPTGEIHEDDDEDDEDDDPDDEDEDDHDK